MKAAVLYEVGAPVHVEEVELSAPLAGEVRVRIAAAGVCHSDHHYMKGDLPHPLPVVLGHEGAGIVEEVGLGVVSVAPGDHVVLLWRSAGAASTAAAAALRFAPPGCGCEPAA